jgi:two-component system heavy metal sensor histidine kinase CusS
MIESVLFLARAEHPQFAMHFTSFDAANQLERLADYYDGIADEAGVKIRIEGSGRVTADEELFRRALSNLLANAIRHTPRYGMVTMRVTVDSANVRISVENEGKPIDPALLERIFDRFYRIDASRNRHAASSASTGLGLAIVRTIMDLHNGSVHAESDSHGSRFILSFNHAPPP